MTESPYLTLSEAAAFCRFDTCANPLKSFRQWANKYGVPLVRRGRVLLVERRVLLAVLHPDQQRHARIFAAGGRRA